MITQLPHRSSEAVIQSDGNQLHVKAVSSGAEGGKRSNTEEKGCAAAGDIPGNPQNRIFSLHAPMQIDALFDTAACGPVKGGGVSVKYANGVVDSNAAGTTIRTFRFEPRADIVP
jgi:hypothetical protein